ncbi:MAG: methylaspartate mutase subunit S, partial [Arcobacteraceae bacterium]
WCREVNFLKSHYGNLLENVVFMIGGNLVVGTGDASNIVPKFKNYGFDLVFHQVDLNTGLDELEKFMGQRA